MSLEPPAYILSLQNNIRQRPISWEGAVRAKTISEGQLRQIRSVDKVRKEQRKQTIESDVDSYITLFFGSGSEQSIFQLAAKAQRYDIVQYLLVLIGDVIDDIESFTQALLKHEDAYASLLPFLKQSNEPSDAVPILSSVVISSILSHTLGASSHTSKPVESSIPKIQSYLSNLVQNGDPSFQDIAVQQYSAVLRNSRARQLFWSQRSETLAPLIDILRAAAGSSSSSSANSINGDTTSDIATSTATTLRPPSSSRASIRTTTSDAALSGNVSIQLLYHVLLVIWQLSFSPTLIASGLNSDHDFLPLYTTLLRISPKEKLTRLILSTLNNLFVPESNSDFLLPVAVAAKLPQLLQNLKSRHLTDEDLTEDLQTLKSTLDDYASTQTTLSSYASELRSGILRWSPPHRNSQFWTENARSIIDDSKGELVKRLAEVLGEKGQDSVVLAVGCNDVACLVRECPEKKGELERCGLKGAVMGLMESEGEEVRWEALRATGEWLRYRRE